MNSPASPRGYVLLVALIVSAAIISISAGLISYFTSSVRAEDHAVASAQALALAEAGVDYALYQLDQSANYTGETVTLGNGTFITSVNTTNSTTKKITATGYVPNSTNPIAYRTVVVSASVDSSVVSFRYGVQVGNGGVTMGNGSQINGSIYSNGPISGGGVVTADATAAGGSSISGITIGGNAWGHTLSSCSIAKNATFSGATTNCSVGGTKFPNSADAATADMPISDAQIADWETIAANGGTITGPYSVSGTATLGPAKINGDLTVTNGAKLILSGPIWVNGNVNFSNNAFFLVSASTGNEGAVLIADATGNTASKGTITITNNVTISGNGNPGSFPMALSTNTGAAAINMNNNATSIILYAPYGTITVSNGATANQLTGKQIILSNNSTLNYVSGLQSQSFSDGPGGSWAATKGTYAITH